MVGGERFVRVCNQDAPRNPSAQTYFEVDLGRISILVFDICGLGYSINGAPLLLLNPYPANVENRVSS